ncbi:MAG: ATP-binding protein [Planctomycetota bacterium]
MEFREPPHFEGEVILEEELENSFHIKTPFIERIFTALQTHQITLQEERIMKVRLCLDEALMNAITHGNKENQSKKIRTKLMMNASSWFIEIADDGEGFSLADIPDSTSEESWMMESGRGILLMNTFTDRVFFYDRGTKVRLLYFR